MIGPAMMIGPATIVGQRYDVKGLESTRSWRWSVSMRFGEPLVASVGPVKRFGQSIDAAHRLERIYDRKALHGESTVGPAV